VGYAIATEVRIAAAPVFPAGGATRALSNESTLSDYPGSAIFAIAADGDRYAMGRGGGFVGTIHGQFVAGRYSALNECAARGHVGNKFSTITYPSAIGLIYICADRGGINSSSLYAALIRCPVPYATMVAWAYHPDFPEVLSVETAYSVGLALEVVLAGSFIGGLFLWLGFPADTTRAISPSSTLRTDRNAGIFRGGIISLVTFFIYVVFSWGPVMLDAILAVVAGAIALTASNWFRLQVARAWLAAQGKAPWRLMRFLEDAHACDALRQAGAVYQFRHVRLQERLAARSRSATPA